eukprot:TRINITY_DN779_c0_g1_i4.p2 TRINITY_DN779_c0_g1~~TRINITY_DN779_c0_g1_i4.p2  ORF type:complete len:108 (-),score=2.72 TRINITY_DN779_c0_g1_i4:237-560(-)
MQAPKRSGCSRACGASTSFSAAPLHLLALESAQQLKERRPQDEKHKEPQYNGADGETLVFGNDLHLQPQSPPDSREQPSTYLILSVCGRLARDVLVELGLCDLQPLR